jgi:hypothetical protein
MRAPQHAVGNRLTGTGKYPRVKFYGDHSIICLHRDSSQPIRHQPPIAQVRAAHFNPFTDLKFFA